VALHHFKAGPIGVEEGKDNAGGIFAWREVSGVSKPMRREEDLSAIADSILRELAFKVLGGGD